MNTKAILRGGPANGASVDIDPRAHRWVWLGGHWYYRDLSNREVTIAAVTAAMQRGDTFGYQHSSTCCEVL